MRSQQKWAQARKHQLKDVIEGLRGKIEWDSRRNEKRKIEGQAEEEEIQQGKSRCRFV